MEAQLWGGLIAPEVLPAPWVLELGQPKGPASKLLQHLKICVLIFLVVGAERLLVSPLVVVF